LYDYFGTSWGLLFSHPADFTPVCSTELALVEKYLPEFTKRNVKCIALSLDSVESHNAWIADILAHGKLDKLSYPIIDDVSRSISVKLGMLDGISKNAAGLPVTCRAVYVIGPDRKVKLSFLYPASTGRNFDEIIRVIDSLQLTAERKLSTPGNWTQGSLCVIAPSVSNDDAKKMFPKGFETVQLPSKKEYLRFTDPS
jgi:1-Cys peroxiredoxin 6